MLDTGLVLSGVAMLVAVHLAARWLATGGPAEEDLLDRLTLPGAIGLLCGRAAAVALDGGDSFGSARAFLVIRGGVEFWPGVVAFLAVLAVTAHRRRESVTMSLSTLAPFALVGYGTYELACLLRDGCYGPASTIGFVPDGLQTRMLPVGIVVGVTILAVGFLLSRLWWMPPGGKILAAIGSVAIVRFTASFTLPYVGDGPPRARLEDAAAGLAVGICVTAAVLTRRRSAAQAGARLHPSPSNDEPQTP